MTAAGPPVAASLEDRVVVVTGGGSGIGQATAIRFARAGARVVVAGRSRGPLDATVAAVEAAGGRALAVVADVGYAESVDGLFRAVADRWGVVDVVVNNAGGSAFGAVTEMTQADWEAYERVGLRSYFLTAKAALSIGRLAESAVRLIVNTASTNVRGSGRAGWSAHLAMKHGALGFTDSLRAELAPQDIRVTLLCVGGVRTPLSERPDVQRELQAAHTEPRYLEPADVAEMTVHIAGLPPQVSVGEIHLFHTGRR